MEITTQRLTLRNILETDTNAIYSYRSLPEVARYQYWKPYTLDDAENFVKGCRNSVPNREGEWMGLAITDSASGAFIGDCAFRTEAASAEIGCNIAPKYQKQGFASEVIRALVDHCFQQSQIRKVFGITDAQNMASVKLMESVGMKKIADFREEMEYKGAWCVEEKYGIERKN